jgi:hypothetical protein
MRPRLASLLLLIPLALLALTAAPAQASIVSLDVTAVQIEPLEGVPCTSTVGEFPDPGVGPYIADITWGDGQTTQGSFSQSCAGTACSLLVAGHHVYREVGTYVLEVHVFNFNSTADGRDAKPITVKDAPLSRPIGRTVGMVPGQEFTAIVAEFGDADLFADPVNYRIAIDWGDGTTSPGTAAADATCRQALPTPHARAARPPFASARLYSPAL